MTENPIYLDDYPLCYGIRFHRRHWLCEADGGGLTWTTNIASACKFPSKFHAEFFIEQRTICGGTVAAIPPSQFPDGFDGGGQPGVFLVRRAA